MSTFTHPQRLALALLRVYQAARPGLGASSCRFVPSCSDYAREAVARFGVWRGSWQTLRRLARCHPLGRSGCDPLVTPGR